MYRWFLSFGLVFTFLGCTSKEQDSAERVERVTMTGVTYQFMSHLPLANASISLVEYPELSTLSDEDGNYTIEGIPKGSQITPVVELNEHRRAHHQLFHADDDLDQVYLQLVPMSIYEQFSILLDNIGTPVDEDACQVVTTVCSSSMSEISDFESFLDHGDAGLLSGASASLTPQSGTLFYFNELVQPDPTLEATSSDGGVLWINVDPGNYLMTAMIPDSANLFPDVLVDCEPGRFVNASPPWGLTAQPTP